MIRIVSYSIFLLPFFLIACQAQEKSVSPAYLQNEYYGIGLEGDANDVQTITRAGTVLMGGSTDVDEALQWMIERSGGGDFLIIRASGSVGYNDYVVSLGKVNSVETLLLDSRAKANTAAVGKRIREAEALFIAGGDQANYVNFWTATEVASAIDYLIHEKKVPVGGTSAGCAVLSEFIFDARHGSVTSSEALANPYDSLVSISKSFVTTPYLQNTVADQHYSQRGREGRHVTFMARLRQDLQIRAPKGIGVDEKTAVCIDAEGNATIFGYGNVYFLQGGDDGPEHCRKEEALTWDRKEAAIRVLVFAGSKTGTPAFNLQSWPAKKDAAWFVKNGVLIKK